MKQNLIVVDENDNIIDHMPQDLVDKKHLIYRTTALWIKNSKGEILLARRGYNMSHHPGKWGPAVAGTVEQGESYKQTIIREAKEELCLKNIKIKKGPKTLTQGDYNHFVQWYSCIVDKQAKEFNFQKEEIAEIKWFSKTEFLKEIKTNPEEFLKRMQEYLEMFE